MADILIIDDDAGLRMALDKVLRRAGHTCRLAEDLERGQAELAARAPDLMLLDLRLPDGSGLDLLAEMRQHGARSPVVVMTAFGTVSSAVSAMKRGAAEFVEKPTSVTEVCQLVNELLDSRAHLDRTELSTTELCLKDDEFELIAECDEMKGILAKARQIASLQREASIGLISTLITGDTGVGKEVIARYIHKQAAAPEGQFVHVNCTALPETLFEAELFGHEKGVFTDAKSEREGLLETADGGTLFLDEIGDMSLALQAKLLVVIETGRFRRLGSNVEKNVNMRVIAAASSQLEEDARAGRFRKDLYHRLGMFRIEMPPLRDRGEDLFRLADYFLGRFSRSLGRDVPRLPGEARERMRSYAWPGNVRELAHSLLRALTHSSGDVIRSDALELGGPDADRASTRLDSLEFDFSSGAVPLARLERRLIEAAFKHARGNVSEAARLLGMPRGTLRYRLEKMGLV